MTTTVTIKHEGPDHHDIQVEILRMNGGFPEADASVKIKVSPGETYTTHVYSTQYLRIIEIPTPRGLS